MQYDIQHISEITKATALLHNKNTVIEHLATDSRRIAFPATTLFFALVTERRDGHAYIAELCERGISNFIVDHSFDNTPFTEANFLVVKNTLLALQTLAAYHRQQFAYQVIGITGSNGKTIVKEWLYQLLSPDYTIIRSPRSYNSQIGVPLSVWQMSAENNLAIFEAGISKPGEMEALANIIQPTIGLLTNIGEPHSDGFASPQQKLEEKLLLFTNTPIIFGRETDMHSCSHQFKTSQQIITWGNAAGNACVIQAIEKAQLTTIINLVYHGHHHQINIPFTDDASIENIIHCWCISTQLGVAASTLQTRINQLQPVDMRLQLVHAINNCTVINDSYSFDITSLSVALDFLAQQQQQTNRTVIISDIPATSSERDAYLQVIEMLKARNIHTLITIGEHWMAFESLLQQSFPLLQQYISTDAFISQFNASHFKNEAILLKGGRVFGFEKIVLLLEKKVHQTLMEINLTAIAHNLKEYRSQLARHVKMMVMVKAFAYGSGSAEIAGLLQFHKVDYLGVAYADEGVELRKAGIHLPIMVMNVDEAAFSAITEYNLEPELFSFPIFNAFLQFLQQQGVTKYPVHIKLDTGMHRLGFEAADIPQLQHLLAHNQYMIVQSVFSHLAASEDPNEDAFTQFQAAQFDESCKALEATLGYSFIQHISNSAAIFRNHQLQYNMVRLGIGLYGVESANTNQVALQTVTTLKTTIAQLRQVPTGETIGYNRRGKTTRPSTIATIRIGYADGFSRRLGNGVGKVYINGQLAPVIGSVCMDMTMIDVTDVPQIQEGDTVEIFGKHLPVQQIASWCQTIPYEILTTISQRVKRVYVEE
ncbi:bifunctional UDP-N-acetylmuramoyl-tripeptide:D-alanyl-D-alanine ligase/alanine racemase [Limnovirga soli]|uniref:Alanine racemase n=1 Tax=Limnovirga soli TaxID=2656915 RepID=A0A8J8FCP6_9BACT|nr:bifunctional UDP-N-acetylmuramoyl-tripeptide:D-alanyl-D-alanine ligase/alanine racemase [Limnovirga soli]NNV55573.1 bifunctional UDP-N-acetylmuramoyl-tripeptide:D-alanyl-D-alanine ligase/alanine racemase [Limnovirga soli]